MNELTLQGDPELYLKNFNNKIWSLYKACQFLNVDTNKNDYIEVVKRSYIAELFYNKYIITVSGTQGVGKTTMVRNLYNIPMDYFPEDGYRGEKIPVLITESKTDQIICKKTLVNIEFGKEEQSNFKNIEISKDDFLTGVKDPEDNAIYYELIVPNTFLGKEGYSLVLLPGIEDTNTLIDNYNKYVLEQSANTIYLFYPGKNAQEDNNKLFKKIVKDFKDVEPIYCITFSDQEDDFNKTLKEEFIKDYNVPCERVVCVGDCNIDKWSIELLKSIETFTSMKQGARGKQLKALRSLMNDNIDLIINDIESELYILEDSVTSPKEVRDILNKINESDIDLRKKVKNELNNIIDHIGSKSLDGVKSNIEEENNFSKIRKTILGRSLKDNTKFEGYIKKHWNNYSNENSLEEAINIALSKRINPFENMKDEDYNKRLNYYREQFDIDTINHNSKNFDHLSNDFIQDIPFIANKYLLSIIEYSNISLTKNLDLKHSNNKVNLNEEVEKAAATRKKALLSVGVLLGVDALDGTINSIPAILGALGIEVSALASTAIFAGIGAGFLAIQLSKNVNSNELSEYQLAKHAIEIIKGQYSTLLYNEYEEYIDHFYDFLRKRLEKRFHIDETSCKLLECKLLLADLKHTKSHIKESISEHPFIKE